VIVIGAGPHGLSAVAHLRVAGVATRAFGETLSFWRQTMPTGMLLRSSPRASDINDPEGRLTLARWRERERREVDEVMSIHDFLDYGDWFQAQAVPDLDRRHVASVELAGDGGFAVTLDDGERLPASRVVVAAGLEPFAFVPPPFGDLPEQLVSHASASPDLDRFAGRSVAVIGGGQSALESAALLHEAGAEVEVLVRGAAIFWLGGYGWGGDQRPLLPPPKSKGPPAPPSWRARKGLYWRGAPTEVGGRYSSWIGAAPDLCHLLPERVRAPLTDHCIRPAGGYWLPDRLREVKITLGRSVAGCEERSGKAHLRLDNGSERLVEHVLLGTGYRIDVRRYPFLSSSLTARLRTVSGSPVLRRGLESSIAGLHFTGAPAAVSFGPAMRFVVGTAYTGPALVQGVLRRRRPLFRWAF
jgi:hypothetical protein